MLSSSHFHTESTEKEAWGRKSVIVPTKFCIARITCLFIRCIYVSRSDSIYTCVYVLRVYACYCNVCIVSGWALGAPQCICIWNCVIEFDWFTICKHVQIRFVLFLFFYFRKSHVLLSLFILFNVAFPSLPLSGFNFLSHKFYIVENFRFQTNCMQISLLDSAEVNIIRANSKVFLLFVLCMI